jgi:hypothetical protein
VFEIAAPILSPAKSEVHSVIRYLNAKCGRPAEIHKQIFTVYGNVMNRHLFLHLKKHLAGKIFEDDDEVQEEVMTWFERQATDFYIQHAMRMRHTVICGPPRSAIFFHNIS